MLRRSAACHFFAHFCMPYVRTRMLGGRGRRRTQCQMDLCGSETLRLREPRACGWKVDGRRPVASSTAGVRLTSSNSSPPMGKGSVPFGERKRNAPNFRTRLLPPRGSSDKSAKAVAQSLFGSVLRNVNLKDALALKMDNLTALKSRATFFQTLE